MKVRNDSRYGVRLAPSQERDGVRIATLSRGPALAEVEALQREVWGMAPDVIVPSTLMYTIVAHGGILLGAYVDTTLAGFVIGLVGRHDGLLYHASHMLGIHPEFQGLGIGTALKQRQREEALAQGLNRMTWTFDPLEARNAYFNLHKLGATTCVYHENLYGDLGDKLNQGLPSDRLIVEWLLDEPATPNGNHPNTARHPLLTNRDGAPEIQRAGVDDGDALTVAVPHDVQILKQRDPEAALAWRLALREALTLAFSRGYVARDFVDGAYLLVREGGTRCGSDETRHL